MTGRRPMNALEGDYTGRGTWANQTRFCTHKDHYFRGKWVEMPVPCLQPARPGHGTCPKHASR